MNYFVPSMLVCSNASKEMSDRVYKSIYFRKEVIQANAAEIILLQGRNGATNKNSVIRKPICTVSPLSALAKSARISHYTLKLYHK